MSTPERLTAGLAFLPRLLDECPDRVAFDALFASWVRAAGYSDAAIDWPSEASPSHRDAGPEPTTDSAGRLVVALTPAGREPGTLWAERPAGEPWADADRHFLKLSARLFERSPALAASRGSAIDPERLSQRLADAAN